MSGAGEKRGGDGGGDGGGRDRKKQKKQYIGGRGRGQYKDKGALKTAGFDRLRTPGVRGILVTCDVRAEPMCCTEIIMALGDAAAERYPKLFEEEEQKGDVGEIDMEKAIADEAAKEKEVGPFSFIRTDVKGLIFVEIRIAEICPMLLCEDYIRKVAASRQAKTKYAVRLTPVMATSYANYDSICKAVQPLLDTHLGKDQPACTYAIIFKRRSNNDVDRLELIKKMADLVDKKHTVDLTTPGKSILVDVMMNACLIGIVPDYYKLKKYNIHELTGQGLATKANLERAGGGAKASPFEGGRVGGSKEDEKKEGERKEDNKEEKKGGEEKDKKEEKKEGEEKVEKDEKQEGEEEEKKEEKKEGEEKEIHEGREEQIENGEAK